MPEKKGKILWVDDEIELLRSHILFLEEKGYTVIPVTNGDDAVTAIERESFDLILLDEMMSGKGGLETLSEIKEISPGIPVIMITKSEEESLMEEAIGSKIFDYLTKPVNPSQILIACKKILEKEKISGEKISRDYISEFNKITQQLMSPMDYMDWIQIHVKLSQWELEIERHPELGLLQTIHDQRRECNVEFGKYIERNYRYWLRRGEEAPILSVNFMSHFVIPRLKRGEKVFLIVMDCLRLDQWLEIEPIFYEYFNISRDYYYSILPTATPYARNSLFSGLFPAEIQQKFSEIWARSEDDDLSMNRYERDFLEDQLKRYGVHLKPELKYIKILDMEEGRNVERNVTSYFNIPFVSMVINFIDILAHSRSDLAVLKEIAPDESAFRSLTRSWFEHSWLLQIIMALAENDCTIILTSDHGSIRALRGSKVIGDKETSSNLRYKYGRSLKCNLKHAIYIKNPGEYKLPMRGINTTYIIAREDYYFVYPTNYYKYLQHYKDSFQHGGASLEEMILPVVIMEGKS